MLAVWPGPAQAQQARAISVGRDPRIELAGVVQFLSPAASDPQGFVRRDLPYLRDLPYFKEVQRRFAAHRKHAALRSGSASALKAFHFSDREQVLLKLSPPDGLEERLAMPYALQDRAGGRAGLESWLAGLRLFSADARFGEFFASSAKLLEPEVSAFRAAVERTDYLGKIEAYAGLRLFGRYGVVLSPFDAPGGMANNVAELDDGSMEITSVIGPAISSGSSVDFWSSRVPGTLWHESGHGILDILGDLFAQDIALSSATLSRRYGWGCYGEWRQCVKEHVVRAVMIRLIAREFGDDDAAEQLRFEDETKYPYLRAMLERLQVYESSRQRYPTLADFYPDLVAVFPTAAPPRRPLTFSSAAASGTGPAPKEARLRQALDQILAKAKDRELLKAARALRGR
ncbi:MAG: DUF4932 domain-containing protein [Elusimicrobia bacterium]|nr:DUF4932 domain-containing protein [Elusimicrobiota bacterium]